MSEPARTQLIIPEQVYPGLRAFRRDESLLFFGRQEHVDELLGRLEDTSFLAVVGSSGGGKSSLVLAGLVPALKRGNLAGASSLWQIAEMRPGSDPLAALTASLDLALAESPGRAERLRAGRLGLVDAAAAGRLPDANLLLVVDQFEELFRFQRDFESKSHEAAEFVRLLIAASNEYDARLYVVITMRSDYLGECARFPGLAEALNDSQYLTPRLTREHLREAVAGPAALREVKVDEQWLESVLDGTSGDREQLPVLQHLLRRMWNRETGIPAIGETLGETDFTAAGGLQALNKHAEDVYNAVGDKDLARRIFQCLTESADPGHENRRPRKMTELVDETGSHFGAVKEIVDRFRAEGCSFLAPPPDAVTDLNPETVIDISHESLIRGWTRLKAWAKEDTDSGEWYRRVEDRLLTSQGKTDLTGSELDAALEARKRGGWNAAWAKRYAGRNPLNYEDVIAWLDRGQRKHLGRTRRKRWAVRVAFVAVAAVALIAFMAVGSVWWGQRALASKAVHFSGSISRNEARGARLPSLESLHDLDAARLSLRSLSGDHDLNLLWISDGTYQQARKVYFEKFLQLLMTQTQESLLDSLRKLPAQAKTLGPDYSFAYNKLKAYLIVTSNPGESDQAFLVPVLLDSWSMGRDRDIGPERLALARKQFEFYADELTKSNPFSDSNDAAAISLARDFLLRFGAGERTYTALVSHAAKILRTSFSLSSSLPGVADDIVDGYQVPGAFTRPGWNITTQAMESPQQYVESENWVFGAQKTGAVDIAGLEARYNAEYVRQWKTLLQSATIIPFASLSDAARRLNALSGNQSTLLLLFTEVLGMTKVGDADVEASFQPVQIVTSPEASQAYRIAIQELANAVDTAAQSPSSGNVAAALQASLEARLEVGLIAAKFRVDPDGHLDQVVRKLLEDPITNVQTLIRK